MSEKISHFEDYNKSETSKEIEGVSDEKFIQETEKYTSEISDYLNTYNNFIKSSEGKEIIDNSYSIAKVAKFIKGYDEEEEFDRNVKFYKETDYKYDEAELKKIIAETKNGIEAEGKEEFKNMFGETGLNDIDRNNANIKLTEYLKSKKIEFKLDSEGIPEYDLNGYTIEISNAGIKMVDINRGKIETLDKMYEIILKKFFSELPKNSVLVYPAIGDDKIFCDIAEKYGHTVIGIDPYAEISNIKLFKQEFASYEKIDQKMRKEGIINEKDNTILIFKGFDTLSDLEQNQLDKIIEEFNGKQIALFGCGHLGMFGQGVPRTEGPARVKLENSLNFEDVTKDYFNQDSMQAMEQITKLSEKLEWTTGFFPATDIKIYSRNKN